jgi:hypothetical protein
VEEEQRATETPTGSDGAVRNRSCVVKKRRNFKVEGDAKIFCTYRRDFLVGLGDGMKLGPSQRSLGLWMPSNSLPVHGYFVG